MMAGSGPEPQSSALYSRAGAEEGSMKPRITINLTASGEFEIWLNEQGRDLLVQRLISLNEQYEHFHLAPSDQGELEVSTRAYDPTDTVIEYGKVLFRKDEWDRLYYPHVLD
jgi:hypothetical protein